MNKLDQDKITHFLQDQAMYNAVRNALQQSLGNPLIFNDDLSNETIGQITRARKEAQKLLDKGFRELELFKKGATPGRSDRQNPH